MLPRIVSLLPSATELVCALGLREQLVGVSHECDYPPGVEELPRVTSTHIAHSADSLSIDRQVSEELAKVSALYQVDGALLATLLPDLLVTQALCDVCAVSASDVEAVACALPRVAQVFNLQPTRLHDILENVTALGAAAGVPERAAAVRAQMEQRIAKVAARTAAIPVAARPRVVMLEWLEPFFDAGHWNPELVELAGGVPVLGRLGQPSTTLDWSALRAAAPDLIFIACCGFNIDRTLQDVARLNVNDAWRELSAVQAGRVWVADGNAYFNRPGPRIVDSLELLAHVLHPTVHPLSAGITPAVRILASTQAPSSTWV
jgi:iron complex transport system substrate-binding protein